MRITVLGSAAGGGFPQWNCNCRQLRRRARRQPVASRRARSRRSSSGPTTRIDGVLFNASPDMLEQIRSNPVLQPARGAARHGDRRRGADGRADRPRDRPLHAARALAPTPQAGASRPPGCRCGAPTRSRKTCARATRCCACSSTTAASSGSASRSTARRSRCRASPACRFARCRCRARRRPIRRTANDPVAGDNIGITVTDRASGTLAVLRARARRRSRRRCSMR